MKKMIAIVTAVVLLGMLALPAAVALDTLEIAPHSANFADEVLRLTNVERARHGLPALSGTNAPLHAAAQRRAVEIAVYFSHTRPNGAPWHTVFHEFDVGPRVNSGENLGRGQTTPAQVVTGWMNSPSHRAILLGQFSHLGVGVHRNSAGTYHWTQLFINSGGSSAPPSGGFNFLGAALSLLSFVVRILTLGLIVF